MTAKRIKYSWSLRILAICLISASILWATKLLIISREYQLLGRIVHRVPTQEKVVALTFDDGPSTARTQQILGILNQEAVRATFFLNGKALKENNKEAKLLVASGHEIGNHSYSHKRMVLMSPREVAHEIESTSLILEQLGYKSSQANGKLLFRPPFGNKFLTLPYYLQTREITTITWDIEPEVLLRDPNDSSEIVNRVVDNVKPGSIVLLHVMYGSSTSLRAVTPIIHRLKANGYTFLTVSELLKKQDGQ